MSAPAQDKLSLWRELLIAAVLTAAVGAAVYWPALDPSQGDVAGRWDVHRQFGPWNYFFDRAIQAGDFPEWDPLVFSGTPHAANPQSWAVYPPNVLRALLHGDPTPLGTLRGIAFLHALHLLVWALGTYRLARDQGLSRQGALLSGMVATFSALMVRRVCEWHFLFSLAVLPWLLLLLRRIAQASATPERTFRARLPDALALGLLFGMAVLGGFLQILPHMVLAMLAYFCVELTAVPRSKPAYAHWLRAAGPTALGACIALGIAAALLVAGSELLSLSPRAAGSGVEVGGHKPEAWDLAYAARSLLIYSGRIYEPETIRGAGILAMALACAGVWARPFKRVLPFVAMLYVLMDLMLGRPWPFSSLLSLVSPVQLVSGTRAFDVAMLPIAVLAGFGLDALRERNVHATLTALVVTLAGVLLLHALLAAGDVWVHPDASVWCVPLSCAAVIALAAIWKRRSLPWLGGALLTLTLAEIISWNRFYAPQLLVMPGFDRQWKERDGFTGEESFWADNRRETSDRPVFSLFQLKGISNGYDPLHLQAYRRAVSGLANPPYRRSIREPEINEQSPRGYLFLKRPFWLLPAVVRGPMPAAKELFAPTESAFVSGDVPSGFPVRAAEEVLGRASSRNTRDSVLQVHSRRVSQNTLEWLTSTGPLSPVHHALVAELTPSADGKLEVSVEFFERKQTRWLPGYKHKLDARADVPVTLEFPMPDRKEADVRLKAKHPEGSVPTLQSLTLRQDLADEDGKIQVLERSPDAVEVQVSELAGPRLLAFFDVGYPGWSAEVDGAPSAIARVNDAFKGVWLAPGTHHVQFHFASARLHRGLWISLFTLIAAAGLWLWSVYPRKRA